MLCIIYHNKKFTLREATDKIKHTVSLHLCEIQMDFQGQRTRLGVPGAREEGGADDRETPGIFGDDKNVFCLHCGNIFHAIYN